MLTPAGKECRHYYEDFHRGRNKQECRLIKQNLDSLRWQPADCAKCIVPDILNANASASLELKVTVTSRFMGMRRELKVEAYCDGKSISIEKAYTGCDETRTNRPGLDLFRQALEQNDDEKDD
jgi:hypothetical protein